MTDDGEASSILEIKLRHEKQNKSIFLSNEQLIKDILEDYDMLNCTSTATLMIDMTISSDACPEDGSEEWHKMQRVPQRECVGRLTHLSRVSRPDLAFSVSVVNRYLHTCGNRYWNDDKRILSYRKGTMTYELMFTSTFNLNDPIYSGYTDADWGGNNDNSKSTSGSAFILGNNLVSWSSKADETVATSTTYAEYIALIMLLLKPSGIDLFFNLLKFSSTTMNQLSIYLKIT